MKLPSFASLSKAVLTFCVTVLVTIQAHAQSVEAIFAAARDYAVHIETRITTPFIEDDPGSYFGAGFLVDRGRGWVMTNAHVIGHSPARLDVTFADGARTRATPVYIDSFLDLAIIAIDPGKVVGRQEAALECAQRPQVGVPVGAYGHPNGFKFTGTRGIVSGLSMRVGSSALQTDAPINAGNSGGPLIRLDTGRVVGINTATLTGRDVQNMNFAVDAIHACRVLELLAAGADPRPPVLDVLFYTEDDEPTLVVARVTGRAAETDLRVADTIVAVDGEALEPADRAELVHRLRGKNGAVTLGVQRNDDVRVSIPFEVVPQAAVLDRRGYSIGGALFARTYFEDLGLLSDDPRLMVHYVAPGSPAESAGLEVYDHVISVNARRAADVERFAELALDGEPDSAVLELMRLVPKGTRFTRHLLAVLPLEDRTWVAVRTQSDPQRSDAAR
jgi:serine protease Do